MKKRAAMIGVKGDGTPTVSYAASLQPEPTGEKPTLETTSCEAEEAVVDRVLTELLRPMREKRQETQR